MEEQSVYLKHILVEGYKSIERCDVALNQINLLIGANGVGKSNFISLFRFIQQSEQGNLQQETERMGGANAILHFGRKRTEELVISLSYENLIRTSYYEANEQDLLKQTNFMLQKREASLALSLNEIEKLSSFYSKNSVKQWNIYHFHDTSASAPLKQMQNLYDNDYLREDGRNLAAFLYRLKHQDIKHYQRIVKTIQLVAPFFKDFHLRPSVFNEEKIRLEWTEKGYDEPFGASALSDGTLRFMCLATALLQPKSLMPPMMLIDEPELGLHPYAIQVLAGLMRSASTHCQLIVSTQSVELLNLFTIDDVIVVDKIKGASTFTRPDRAQLNAWLDEYSLGELWNKNLLGGRPK